MTNPGSGPIPKTNPSRRTSVLLVSIIELIIFGSIVYQLQVSGRLEKGLERFIIAVIGILHVVLFVWLVLRRASENNQSDEEA